MGSYENDQVYEQYDFDLHGIVGVRLLNASPKDYAVVKKQLGPIEGKLDRDPDIVINFVDKLPIDSTLNLLGLDDAGFTDEAYIVLRGKHKSSVRVQIPFEKIGQKVEVLCERGLLAVPELIHIVNITALSKGVIPLHASAFAYNGVGVLVTGWAKGGKTETLLAFTSKGAEYIGDEWVYLSKNGESMFGIPEPIHVWEWHLRYLPDYWSLLKSTDRARLWGLRLVVGGMESVISKSKGQGSAPVKLLRRMQPLLRNQMYVQLPPHKLFEQDGRPRTGKPEKVLFVASHESDDISVSSIDPEEVAHRMVFSLQRERMDFMSAYLKFRFAFPDLRNDLLEETENIQRKLLKQALSGKECYAVFHPYPVNIPALFEAVNPLLNR